MHRILSRHITLICLLAWTSVVLAQVPPDNGGVGIGTSNPHPSALLDISDSSRGVLIPRTDTLAVAEYVNNLNPNPGIADGLMIFDINLNTYVYYDASNNSWRRLIDLVGPSGPQGFQGPTGPTGPQGTNTDWRDSNLAVPNFDPIRDTCGDWYINYETGQVWRFWCDSAGNNNMWRDTNFFDFYIGEMKAPDERVEVYNLQANDDLTETMANSADIVVMKPIAGLAQQIQVELDEIAYIWFAAHGSATRAFPGGDLAYAQYDVDVGGFFYNSLIRGIESQVTLGPSGPPPPGQPLQALSDRPGWYISGQYQFAGPISAAPQCRCGSPWQDPGCSCPPPNSLIVFSVHGGNRYSGSATTNVVILADEVQKEAVGHLNLFVVIRRNPNTWPWKR